MMEAIEAGKKKPKKELSKHTKIKILLVFIAVIAIVALGIFVKVGIFSGRQVAPAITGEMLGQQLYGVEELVSVEYHYTSVAKFEDSAHFFSWNVPLTKKRFLITYEGAILAGVRDLSQVQFSIEENESGEDGESIHVVRVTIPPSEILSHEIFENSVEVYDESRNVFNPIQVSDFPTVMAENKESDKAKAVENGLLLTADEQARSAIEALLLKVPGMEEYELVFEQ
ncbi:MAG: DUF4230 domain-containing protein [Oscillospiraceae bacterium]|nr:DUF4230 domain-containing protein [Oscillospiraceae bacterium]